MAKTAKTKTPEVLEVALDTAQQAAAEEAIGLVTFLQGLAGFFSQAKALEVAAQNTLLRARATVPPTTQDADALVQHEVRTARTLRKQIEDHWGITAIVSRFHKKLTAKRAVATDACEQAERTLVALHDRYVADEKRRAWAAQQELQRQADARAEQERAASLAEYEAAALKAEESSPELSVREHLFVRAVVHSNYDPVVAAREAGYKDPTGQASRLLASDKVRAAIKAAQDARAIRSQKAIIETLPAVGEEVEVVAELNTGDRYTWTGEVVDLELLRKEAFTNRLSGIPLDLFIVDQTKLNQYARSLHERLELWPGVVAKRKTTVL